MEEFQIINGSTEHCQKILNQWRHQYYIIFYGMCQRNDEIVIVVSRTKKEAK